MRNRLEKQSPGHSATLRSLVAIAALIVLLGSVQSGAAAMLIHVGSQDPAHAGSPGPDQAPQAAVPRILSPEAGLSYVFGESIAFSAVDDNHQCLDTPYTMSWKFERDGHWLPGRETFTPGRMLDFQGGTHVMPLPGVYRVTVMMCGVESLPVQFSVVYDTPVTGQHHPRFDDANQNIVPPCIDWDDLDNSDNHRTSAHFNIYWNTQGQTCDPVPQPVSIRQPTDVEIGYSAKVSGRVRLATEPARGVGYAAM